MSTEKSDAIVLRTVPWSETSCIVTLFTKDFGKISAIAKGARRPKSSFETSLDLLAKSQVVFIHKGNDVLDLLTESKLFRRFRSGQHSLLSLYCGYYAAELLLSLTEHHHRISHLFELLDQTLVELDAGNSPAELILRLEMQLLRMLGHLPTFRLCAGCGNPVESDPNSLAIRLGIAAGGVLCPECLPGQRAVLRIQGTTWSILVQFAEAPWNERPHTIDSENRGEIRFVMEKFITHLADRPLRLIGFLEELKR